VGKLDRRKEPPEEENFEFDEVVGLAELVLARGRKSCWMGY
jgi:hypothetical protein